MTKLTLINVVATLALAGVLSAGHMSPTLAASVVPVPAQPAADVVLIAYQIEEKAPGLFDRFLALSTVERDHLLFQLADRRSMRLLSTLNAAKPTGPMDAR